MKTGERLTYIQFLIVSLIGSKELTKPEIHQLLEKAEFPMEPRRLAQRLDDLACKGVLLQRREPGFSMGKITTYVYSVTTRGWMLRKNTKKWMMKMEAAQRKAAGG